MTHGNSRIYQRLLSRWESFWFEDIPPHVYALLRITFGCLGLVNLLGLTPVSMFWPVGGINPVPGHDIGLKAQLVASGLGTIVPMAYFAGLLLSFLSMTVGYMSGLAVRLCFVGSVLQSFWNHLPLSAANQLLVAMLFCLVWADTAAVWSLDAWLARKRLGAATLISASAIWPLRLMRFQIALVYLNSGLWKLFGATWRDGSAVHYSMELNIFHRFPYAVPVALEWMLTLLTYITLFWEIGFAFMLFQTWTRRAALTIGVLIHTGLWFTLELGPFSWVVLASYLAFLDPHALPHLVARGVLRRSDRQAVAV